VLIPKDKIRKEFLPLLDMTWDGKARISIILCSAIKVRSIPQELWVPRYCRIIISDGYASTWSPYYGAISYPSRQAAINRGKEAGKDTVLSEYYGPAKRITLVAEADPCRSLSGTVNRALRLLLRANPGLDVIGGLI